MFADWIRQALKNSGITQSELSRRLSAKVHREVNRSAVNKLTKDQRTLTADELLAISEITGTPVPWGIHPSTRDDTPSRVVLGSRPIDEDRLKLLIATSLEWHGIEPDQAKIYASTLIEFARNSPDRAVPRTDHEVRIEAQTIARLFSTPTPLVKGSV
jgi:transcriptional regulator with XRE-family HTH domain